MKIKEFGIRGRHPPTSANVKLLQIILLFSANTLLAFITLSADQSSAQRRIHTAILVIDTSNNASYNQVHWLVRMPYLSIKASNEEISKEDPVHCGVQYDGCNMSPLCGKRYKCATCYDYDLCESCENQGTHPQHDEFHFIRDDKVSKVKNYILWAWPLNCS